MKKPSVREIRESVGLAGAGGDVTVCAICLRTVDASDLPGTIWREHDEEDRPIAGDDALVHIGSGKEHAACRKAIDDHPRLYAEETGAPGLFPWLCGTCPQRSLRSCTDPRTRANGGDGLRVELADPLRGAIICGRGGRIRTAQRAVKCEGKPT